MQNFHNRSIYLYNIWNIFFVFPRKVAWRIIVCHDNDLATPDCHAYTQTLAGGPDNLAEVTRSRGARRGAKPGDEREIFYPNLSICDLTCTDESPCTSCPQDPCPSAVQLQLDYWTSCWRCSPHTRSLVCAGICCWPSGSLPSSGRGHITSNKEIS